MGGRIIRMWPDWVTTVRKMQRSDNRVFAFCEICGTRLLVTKADLFGLEMARGPHFCLIDRRPQCKAMVRGRQCEGRVVFQYEMGSGLPSVPLLSSDRKPHPASFRPPDKTPA